MTADSEQLFHPFVSDITSGCSLVDKNSAIPGLRTKEPGFSVRTKLLTFKSIVFPLRWRWSIQVSENVIKIVPLPPISLCLKMTFLNLPFRPLLNGTKGRFIQFGVTPVY